MTDEDEEHAEADAGRERQDGTPGRAKPPRPVTALEADHADGGQAQGDAHVDEWIEVLAGGHGIPHRQDSGGQRRHRCDNAHRPGRQGRVEDPETDPTRAARRRSPRQRGGRRRTRRRERDAQEHGEADRCADQNHGERGHPTRGRPAEEVAGAIERRRYEREQDDHGRSV